MSEERSYIGDPIAGATPGFREPTRASDAGEEGKRPSFLEQYEAVLDAFKRVRKILNSLPTKTPDRNQRAQILDVLDHAHEYTSSETEWLAKSIRAILSSEEEER